MSAVSKDSDQPSRSCSPIKDVAGVILAGGKSLRYGKNKGLAKINGIPLIERVVQVMNSLFQHLIIITNTPDEYAYLRLPMHEDLIKRIGPLGGIFTGLSVISNNAGFFVACDMPLLNRELIRHMVENKNDFDAVVPRVSEEKEALHALYSKRCLPAIRRLIDTGEYRVIRFFHEVSVWYVDEDEIRSFDPELRSFFNVNSPHDLRRS